MNFNRWTPHHGVPPSTLPSSLQPSPIPHHPPLFLSPALSLTISTLQFYFPRQSIQNVHQFLLDLYPVRPVAFILRYNDRYPHTMTVYVAYFKEEDTRNVESELIKLRMYNGSWLNTRWMGKDNRSRR